MKRFGLRLARDCGAFALTRTLSARMARILMYHNFCADNQGRMGAVTARAFLGQLAHLRRHFRVASLARIVEQLRTGEPLANHTVALTVDDGRRNFYEFCFPLLKKFAVPVTFFAVSSFIRGEDWVWTDKVLWLSGQPSRPSELSPDKIEALFGTLNRMRPEKRNEQIAAMASRMRVVIPQEPPAEYAPCSWAELREMADTGLVEIGSHTVTHPILASISDEESWSELTVSRAQLEEGVGREVRLFCFPNGKPGDYRPNQVRQIIDAGYACAVAALPGMVANGADPYELPRLGVGGDSDALSFSKDVDAAEYYQAKLQALLGLRSPPV